MSEVPLHVLTWWFSNREAVAVKQSAEIDDRVLHRSLGGPRLVGIGPLGPLGSSSSQHRQAPDIVL
jgi:hypothetical protein